MVPASAAQHDLALTQVAAQAGFSYAWLGTERAVEISKPGMVIVLRPGDSLFDVNDRVESTAVPPRYANNDLYVSASLAKRIGQLGRQSQYQAAAQRTVTVAQLPPTQVSGAISLEVHPLEGTEAVVVQGTAPPYAPLTITLMATLSSDIPTVVVSRNDVHTDSNGRFAKIIPIAPDFLRGSIMDVLATSLSGVTPATAQFIVGPPNGKTTVPADNFPGGIW
jgi:hypothetical protein